MTSLSVYYSAQKDTAGAHFKKGILTLIERDVRLQNNINVVWWVVERRGLDWEQMRCLMDHSGGLGIGGRLYFFPYAVLPLISDVGSMDAWSSSVMIILRKSCMMFVYLIGVILFILSVMEFSHRTTWLDTYRYGHSEYATEWETLAANNTLGDIYSVDISPDDKKIAYYGNGVEIYDCELKSRKSINNSCYSKVNVQSVRFSPDGSKIAYGGSEGVVGIADVTSTNEIMVLEGPMQYIRSVNWSPDGTRIIVSTDRGSVILLDLSSRKAIKAFQGYKDYDSFASSFSPDGKVVYSGHGDGTLCAWSVEGGELIWYGDEVGCVEAMSLYNDGRNALTAHRSSSFAQWNLQEQRCLRFFTVSGLPWRGNWIMSITVSPDNRVALFGTSEGSIIVWDLEKWERIERFQAHTNSVKALCFSHDGKWFVSGDWDGIVRIWGVNQN